MCLGMLALHVVFFSIATATPQIYTLSLHDALPIYQRDRPVARERVGHGGADPWRRHAAPRGAPPRRRECRSEEHTSELQSRVDLVCRLLLEKKKLESTIK